MTLTIERLREIAAKVEQDEIGRFAAVIAEALGAPGAESVVVRCEVVSLQDVARKMREQARREYAVDEE